MARKRVVRPVGHAEKLSLIEHLDELRTRLILCIVVLVACFMVCYWQNDWLLETVNKPLTETQNLQGEKSGSRDPLEQTATFQIRSAQAQKANADFQRQLSQALAALADRPGTTAADRALLESVRKASAAAQAANTAAVAAAPTSQTRLPVTLGVTEPFVTTFTLSAYAALLLALPFLLYQAYAFVLPAFSPEERRVALPLMLMVPVLFIAGVAFGYFVALPRAIGFLQNFNDDAFDILVRASDYYRFSVVLLAVIGLLFQIPVGVLAVTRLGLISARQLAKNRGYVILALAIVAAVATPTPDPVTMLVAMAPLVILFELSVQFARIFERRRERADDEEEAEEMWSAEDDDVHVS